MSYLKDHLLLSLLLLSQSPAGCLTQSQWLVYICWVYAWKKILEKGEVIFPLFKFITGIYSWKYFDHFINLYRKFYLNGILLLQSDEVDSLKMNMSSNWRITLSEVQNFLPLPHSRFFFKVSLASIKELEMSHTAAGYPGGLLIFKGDCSGMSSRAASHSCHELFCGQKQQKLLISERQSNHQTWNTNIKCKMQNIWHHFKKSQTLSIYFSKISST